MCRPEAACTEDAAFAGMRLCQSEVPDMDVFT